MKNLAVTLLFALSLFGLLGALRVEALSSPRIEPRQSRPVPLAFEGKDDKDDDDKDDEEEEEEYRGVAAAQALLLVDPTLSQDLLRLRLALQQPPVR